MKIIFWYSYDVPSKKLSSVKNKYILNHGKNCVITSSLEGMGWLDSGFEPLTQNGGGLKLIYISQADGKVYILMRNKWFQTRM